MNKLPGGITVSSCGPAHPVRRCACIRPYSNHEDGVCRRQVRAPDGQLGHSQRAVQPRGSCHGSRREASRVAQREPITIASDRSAALWAAQSGQEAYRVALQGTCTPDTRAFPSYFLLCYTRVRIRTAGYLAFTTHGTLEGRGDTESSHTGSSLGHGACAGRGPAGGADDWLRLAPPDTHAATNPNGDGHSKPQSGSKPDFCRRYPG